MDKFFDWISSKFHEPLSVIFCLAGMIFILLGIDGSLKVPIFDEITVRENSQWISLIIGVTFCLLGVVIFIYFYNINNNGNKKNNNEFRKTAKIKIDEIFKSNLYLSDTQKNILGIIHENISRDDQTISEEEIRNKIKKKINHIQNSNNAEIYYRLEQLYWMGILEKHRVGYSNSYNFSKEYWEYYLRSF